MPSISLASAAMFERLSRDAQDASNIQDFRAKMMETLQRELGADSGALLDRPNPRGAPRAGGTTVGLGTSLKFIPQYLREQLRYEASLGRIFSAMRDGRPVVDTEVYSLRERERLDAYVEILRPQGATSILSAFASWRGRATGVMVLKRHGRGRGFSSRDVNRFASMLPAIGLAEAGLRLAFEVMPLHVTQRLSARESQVTRLVCKGMQNAEIAVLLGTSRDTVKKQVRSILTKLGATNRTELAGLLGAEPAAL